MKSKAIAVATKVPLRNCFDTLNIFNFNAFIIFNISFFNTFNTFSFKIYFTIYIYVYR